MTETELRSLYTDAYKIAQRERKARMFVFRDSPEVLRAKTAEMDRLLHILATLKDALKPHCDPDFEQPRLLDVPRPYPLRPYPLR
jgi:hypothetical protein